MLLVDDDQARGRSTGAKTAERGPTHDARLAACAGAATRRSARPTPSAECSTATPSPKRASKRASDLRRERDLGHQHDRARPGSSAACDGAQVDLGLARAGHAVKQNACTWRRHPIARSQRRQCALLIFGERGRVHRSAAAARRPAAAGHAGLDPDRPRP